MAPYLGPFLLVGLCLFGNAALSQPSCTPPTPNATCATAAPLAVNANCINGTTCSGGVQGASTCLYAGSQCSWYSFTATATSMYVNIDVTATSGCHISSNVYRATGPCTGLTQVSCLSGAPLDDMHPLLGLTIGSLYYIQVCYSPGGPCGNSGSAQYCVEVGVPDPPCSTCSTPCGDAFGYTTTPTIAQVVGDCTSNRFRPPLQPSTTHTFCNTFTATNSTVSFNVIITSDCGMGNVTAFTWALYNSPSCGTAIQTGTIANLTFTGLTVGNSYVFCYTFTVPAGCTHTQHCPYFVGATVPLPVTWLGFEATAMDNDRVDVHWTTASEQNSDHFTVQRSADAIAFSAIGMLPGAGTSYSTQEYHFADHRPLSGVSYYRVEQTDLDGSSSFTQVVSVKLNWSDNNIVISPNPVSGDGVLWFNASNTGRTPIEVLDAYGRVVLYVSVAAEEGPNSVTLATSALSTGIYWLSVGDPDARGTIKFMVE